MQDKQDAAPGGNGQYPSSSAERRSSSNYGLEMQRQNLLDQSANSTFFQLYGLQPFQQGNCNINNMNLSANGYQQAGGGGGDFYGKGMPAPVSHAPPPGFHAAAPTGFGGFGNCQGAFFPGYHGQAQGQGQSQSPQTLGYSSSSSSSPSYFQQQQTEDNNRNNVSSSSTLSGLSLGGGIKPLIDNIVGSMMGNGTYTHFGPAGGAVNLNQEFGLQQHQHQQQIPKVDEEMKIRRPQESPVMREMQAHAQSSSGRTSASSEKGENNASRPQTPSVSKGFMESLISRRR